MSAPCDRSMTILYHNNYTTTPHAQERFHWRLLLKRGTMRVTTNGFVTLLMMILVGWAATDSLETAFVPALRRIRPRTKAKLGGLSHYEPFNRAGPTQLCMIAQDDDGPDSSILIASKDNTTQQLAFVASFAALAAGTTLCVNLWHGPGEALLGPESFETVRGTIFPIVFGIIFAVVGVLHFVFVENFARIVPPKGTWGGLWQAPAPFADELGVTYGEYHSYWSGVVEFLGGLYLLASGLGYTETQVPAFLLFLLTICVTPANLYMFTHDAQPGGNVPKLAYPIGHIARFVVQCGLLSNFYIMAFP